MSHRRIAVVAFVAGVALFPLAGLSQDPVKALRDLVGARASSGESQMNSRGYVFVRTEKAGDSSFGYWREARSNRCVTVRTANGQYASIVYAPESDCVSGGQATQLPASSPGGEDDFETVCGVVSGGQEHAYRCRLRNEGCKGGGCRTVVTMPDNEYTIAWGKNDDISVTFSGMNPTKSTASFKDGRTQFALEGQTYFVYRSPERAKRELAKLR